MAESRIKQTVFYFSSSDEDTPPEENAGNNNPVIMESEPRASTPHSPPQDVMEGVADLLREASLLTDNNLSNVEGRETSNIASSTAEVNTETTSVKRGHDQVDKKIV